jgi:hypothetical protein
MQTSFSHLETELFSSELFCLGRLLENQLKYRLFLLVEQ